MCEAVESYAKSYAEKYAENARLNSLLETIKNFMAAMKVSDADKAMLLKKL